MDTSVVINEELQQKLWAAAAAGDCATIRVLAMSGEVDISYKNEDGFNAFNLATQAGKAEAATVILAAREVQQMRALGLMPDEKIHLGADADDDQKTA